MDHARAIPILPSPNIPVSRDFYRDRLGFEVGFQDDNYLIVRRDEMEIHFWYCEDRKLPGLSSVYIRGGQIEQLHEEFKHTGVERLTALAQRPWNMKEFYVHDPHGNLLRFGCSPEET